MGAGRLSGPGWRNCLGGVCLARSVDTGRRRDGKDVLPVGSDDENVGVDQQVLSVAASDIDPNSSVGEIPEKLFNDRPGLQSQ